MTRQGFVALGTVNNAYPEVKGLAELLQEALGAFFYYVYLSQR